MNRKPIIIMIAVIFMSALILFLLTLDFFTEEKPNTEKEIIKLLTSNKPRDLIIGAFQAGNLGKKKFIPLLLLNADNPSMCGDIRFKGFSVYQEKMLALEKILKVKPPVKLNQKPDSTIIRFYLKLSENR